MKLPQELLDKVRWLSSPESASQGVAVEVRGQGFVRIVPRHYVDSLLARDPELAPTVARRFFTSQVEDGQRLVLPPFFEGRIFDTWTELPPQKVVLECQIDHVSVLSTQAWTSLIAKENDRFADISSAENGSDEP